MKKAKLIVFEGGEGCGKSTQIKMLAKHLKKQGHKVLLTFEPGGTKLGRKIRDLLLHSKNISIVPLAELFLMQAQRSAHVQEVLLPAMTKYDYVLCDRFIDSSIVYQGYARKISKALIEQLNGISARGVHVDRTFVLSLDPKYSLHRLNNRKSLDRFEKENNRFHRLVFNAYRIISKQKRHVLIDASLEKNKIFKTILSHMGLK